MVLVLASSTFLVVIAIAITTNLTDMPSLTGYAASANNTAYTVFNNVFSSFNLVTVVPIVIIAAVLIFLLISSFMALECSGAMG